MGDSHLCFFVLFVHIRSWSRHRELIGIVLRVSGWHKYWTDLSVFISMMQCSDLRCHSTPLNVKSVNTTVLLDNSSTTDMTLTDNIC